MQMTPTQPDNTSRVFRENKGRWDVLNSTYKWEINQKGNPIVLTGYSKGRNMAEKVDKEVLLQDKVEMFVKNGYFTQEPIIKDNGKTIKPLKYISFFKNHKGNPTLMFTLFHSHFVAEPEILDDSITLNFLNRFYEMLSNGEEPVRNLKKNPAQSTERLYDPKIYRAFTHEQLVAHCEAGINVYNFPKGQISAYYKQYRENFLDNENQPKTPVRTTQKAVRQKTDNGVKTIQQTVKETIKPKTDHKAYLSREIGSIKQRHLNECTPTDLAEYCDFIRNFGNRHEKGKVARYEAKQGELDPTLVGSWLIGHKGTEEEKEKLKALMNY